MDDRALENQLRDIAWSATFDAPPLPRLPPSSSEAANGATSATASSSFLGSSRAAAPRPLSHRVPWAEQAGVILEPVQHANAAALPMTSRRIALQPRGPAGAVPRSWAGDETAAGSFGGGPDGSSNDGALLGSLLMSAEDASKVGGQTSMQPWTVL